MKLELFAPLGLQTSRHMSACEPGTAQSMLNCDVNNGVLQARAGIGLIWRRPHDSYDNSDYSEDDVCYGMAFARYGGEKEIIAIVKHAANTHCDVYSINPEDGTFNAHFDVTAWNYRYASDWHFCQQGEYLYAVNQNDGYWKKKIGDYTEPSWAKVNITLVNAVGSSTSGAHSASISTPAPSYAQSNLWNSGSWAGAYSVVESGFWGAPTSAITSNELVFTIATDSTRHPNGKLWHVFTYTTPINLERSRYWSIPVSVDCEWDDTRQNEEPYLDILGAKYCRVLISSDATAPASALTDFDDPKWIEVRAYMTPNDVSPSNSNQYASVSLSVDFEELQAGGMNTALDSVKKIAIFVPISAGNNFTCTVGVPYQGGNMLSKPSSAYFMDGGSGRAVDPFAYYGAGTFKDIEYAVTYYNTGTLVESEATKLTVNSAYSLGAPIFPNALPLGAKVSITHGAASGGYDRVRIYRKRHSDGGQWYLIYQSSGSSASSYTDSFVDDLTDPLDWDSDLGAVTQEIYEAGHDFGFTEEALYPSAITAWRGHMVLGVGSVVYLSYQGEPEKFVAPQWESAGILDTDDPTLGRTLYMSYTLGDSCLALHAPNELYAIGSEGVYAMVGESALDSTPFRRLPGAHGCIGARASCPLNDGVLVATYYGLFWYKIARVGTAIEMTTTEVSEVTKDVRQTYLDLIGMGSPNDVVVQVHQNQIFIIRGRFFMKRNKDGGWEFGAWHAESLSEGTPASGPYGVADDLPDLPVYGINVHRREVKSDYTGFGFSAVTGSGTVQMGMQVLHSDPEMGLMGATKSGMLVRLENDLDGTPFVTDIGYPIPWIYCWNERIAPYGQKVDAVRCLVESETTAASAGVVRVLIEEWDGVNGARAYGQDKLSSDGSFNVFEVNSEGGFGHTVTVVGQTSAHKVARMFISFSDVGARRGN